MLFRKASLTDQAFIHLAKTDLDIRRALTPFVRQAAGWDKLPRGWTQDSVKKFWESLTGENKHKVTKCIDKMKPHMDEPGGFCASIADMVDPGWRTRKKKASIKKWDSKFMDASTARMLGDMRYVYKPIQDLSSADQMTARRAYNMSSGAKYDFLDDHYYYPTDIKGRLARARRVLAIPYKLITDDSYMASLGYHVNPSWTPKTAFNKYNVPEILSQLMAALHAAGMEDTVKKLNQMGVTRLVNDAWANRSMIERLVGRYAMLKQAEAPDCWQDYKGGKHLTEDQLKASHAQFHRVGQHSQADMFRPKV